MVEDSNLNKRLGPFQPPLKAAAPPNSIRYRIQPVNGNATRIFWTNWLFDPLAASVVLGRKS
jgi:hypothetical protein